MLHLGLVLIGPGLHLSWSHKLLHPEELGPQLLCMGQLVLAVNYHITYHLFILCCSRDGVQKIGVLEQVNSLVSWLHEDHGVAAPLSRAADVPPSHPLPLLVNPSSEHWHPHVGSNAAADKEQEEDGQDNA